MPKFDPTFATQFRIPELCMHVSGTHPCVPKNKIHRILHSVLFIVFFTLILSSLFNSLIFHELSGGNYIDAISTGGVLIIGILIISKYFMMLLLRKKKKWLIQAMDRDYKSAKQFTRAEQDVIMQYIAKGIWVAKMWLFLPSMICVAFVTLPLTLMWKGYQRREFHLEPVVKFTYPALFERHKEEPIVFIPVYVMFSMFALTGTSVYGAFAPLAPIFILHACGQLEIIRARILALFAGETIERDKVKQKLKQVIVHLEDVYTFVECIREVTVALYELSMKISTVLIPFCTYVTLRSLKHGRFEAQFFTVAITCLVHFYIQCYYSDLLMEKGDGIFQAVYNCDWESHPILDIRLSLLILMVRSSRSLGVRSVFYTINLDAFSEMCRQTYTIFNLMNAAWGF